MNYHSPLYLGVAVLTLLLAGGCSSHLPMHHHTSVWSNVKSGLRSQPSDRGIYTRPAEQERAAWAASDAHKKKVQEMADQGDPKAQWNYAIRHAKGPERIDYLCRAGRQGQRGAQFLLGRALQEGDYWSDAPVAADPVRAYVWYTLADKNNYVMAAGYRDNLLVSMTPAQLAEGERLAAAWTPQSSCP